MPKIDNDAFEAAQESSGGGISQMMPGAYILRIQAVRTEGTTRSGHWTSDQKQYVQLVYDVAEGEFAGKYSDEYFTDAMGRVDADKDYMHVHYLSWKNMGYLKKQLRVLSESNPGFDARAAFEADKWEMFVGKLFGAVLDGEVDTNDRGYDRWRLSVGDIVTVQDVRSGNCRDPKVEDKRTPAAPAPSTYDDVPFM